MSELSCEHCRDLLPWLARDALPSDDVQQHLAECADCRALFAQWQAIAVATRMAYERIPVPSDEHIASVSPVALPIQGETVLTVHASSSDASRPLRPVQATRPPRRSFPLVATLLGFVLIVVLAGFGFLHFQNQAGSPIGGTPTPSVTAPVVPTDTPVPATATPHPVLPPPPTHVPRPTATPKPVTPGNLAVTGGEFNATCPYSDPPNEGGGEFTLANTGGRTILWSATTAGAANFVLTRPTAGTIAPGGKGVLDFSGYSGTYDVTFTWSDPVLPMQTLTAQTGCVQVGGP